MMVLGKGWCLFILLTLQLKYLGKEGDQMRGRWLDGEKDT
jgi:hypothetical protein